MDPWEIEAIMMITVMKEEHEGFKLILWFELKFELLREF